MRVEGERSARGGLGQAGGGQGSRVGERGEDGPEVGRGGVGPDHVGVFACALWRIAIVINNMSVMIMLLCVEAKHKGCGGMPINRQHLGTIRGAGRTLEPIHPTVWAHLAELPGCHAHDRLDGCLASAGDRHRVKLPGRRLRLRGTNGWSLGFGRSGLRRLRGPVPPSRLAKRIRAPDRRSVRRLQPDIGAVFTLPS